MGAKDMKDYIPILDDQGVPNLCGAYAQGVSLQHFTAAMPADGVITFASVGASNMANATYACMVHNNTGATQGTVAKTATQITVTGPTEADSLDVIIVGTLDGQQV